MQDKIHQSLRTLISKWKIVTLKNNQKSKIVQIFNKLKLIKIKNLLNYRFNCQMKETRQELLVLYWVQAHKKFQALNQFLKNIRIKTANLLNKWYKRPIIHQVCICDKRISNTVVRLALIVQVPLVVLSCLKYKKKIIPRVI